MQLCKHVGTLISRQSWGYLQCGCLMFSGHARALCDWSHWR